MTPVRTPPLPLRTGPTAAWLLLAVASFHAAYELPGASPLILLFFVALYQLGRQPSGAHCFRVGWILGLLIYAPQLAFFFGIFGVSAIGLWLVLSTWLGVFLMLERFVQQRVAPAWTALAIPALWLGLEYSRSELYYLRFSWVNAGYALPGTSAWVGMYGVGFVCMLIAAVVGCIAARRGRTWAAPALAAGMVLLLFAEHRPAPATTTGGIVMAGVQMEFPSTKQVTLALDRAHRAHPDAQLLVLSEYTFDGPPPPAVREWCAAHQRHLVCGGRAKLDDSGYEFENTAFVIGPDGTELFRQVKCVPIQFFKDGQAAQEQRVWESPWGKVGICVCYDLSYTRVTDELVRQGAQVLVVPTMDLASWGERQHELHARVAPVRAAEYGVPIFRLCSSGISQAVDADGHVLATADFPGDEQIMAAHVAFAPNGGTLPVDRYACWAAVAFTLGILIWCLISMYPRRKIAAAPVAAHLVPFIALTTGLGVAIAPAIGWQEAPAAPVAPAQDLPAPQTQEGDDGTTELPAAGREVSRAEYKSPYTLKYSVPESELLFDRDEPRGKAAQQSSIAHDKWYSEEVRKRWGAWGPPAKRFTCPERVHEWSAEKKRERVVATAARHLGFDYQHHHIPDWNPPKEWPWKKCCTGHNGPGIDCSNFSSWNYNWALGIHMSSAIVPQSQVTKVQQGEREIAVQRIERPATTDTAEGAAGAYKDLCAALKPGDLLYIKSKPDAKVSHVIMWVGSCSVSPDNTPLVIDSTGSGHVDSNGVAIPSGVHLRPFTEGSWYFKCFSHAHRLIQDTK